jgi:hypothetical protein
MKIELKDHKDYQSYTAYPGNELSGGSIGLELVAELLELFWLKCADHCYSGDMTSTHFKQNNPMVCRVTSR